VSEHPRWKGNPRQYQLEAQGRYAEHHAKAVLPWSWVTTGCGVDQCLNPECMTLHAARKIRYPWGLCVYCGQSAATKDHLLPRPATGDTLRHLVAVVPACGNCNSRISDHPSPNVAERRKVAQLSIERSHKRLLLRGIRGPAELRELGPLLRSTAVKNNRLYEVVRSRLAWPDDPFYDLRAFEKSGIPDPVALGMCDAIATPLRPEYQEASA
jgi:hypothetical protein